jgi:hypothetical protein
MNYTVVVASGSMLYIPNFMTVEVVADPLTFHLLLPSVLLGLIL